MPRTGLTPEKEVAERISVRAFVEFLLREGDIDNRSRASSETAMREGTRVHRKIQRMRGALYRAEVPLSFTVDTGRYLLMIEGRADGILETGILAVDHDAEQMSFFSLSADDASWEDAPLIEEIKGTYRNLSKIDAPLPVHLAQALCYAHFYCQENDCARVRICMTYCNLDTDELKSFTSHHTAEELAAWFDDMVARYRIFSDYRFDHALLRTASVRQLPFPYPYRDGQKELAEAVYRTIVHGKKLFLEAPTGTGKTLATLYPAIKAVGEGKAERIFFLTARTITRQAPEEAMALMQGEGALSMTYVTITAKEKICLNDVCDCNPEVCPYAKGHYDRVNDAIYDLLTHEQAYPRETILTYAKKHMVCPFEYALDVSEFADVVICDYNYLFDPFVYLRRFFADGEQGDNLFLIDEAHNLVDRGREMYSAHLSAAELNAYLSVTSRVKRLSAVHEKLLALSDELQRIEMTCPVAGEKRGQESYVIVPEIERLFSALKKLNQTLSDYLDDKRARIPRREEMLSLFFLLNRFRTIYEGMDGRYTIYGRYERTQPGKSAQYVLRIFCVDPSGDLAGAMQKGVASILFSATLLPVQYYKRLLGGETSDYEVYAQSCFTPEKCAHVIVDDVTSRYTARGSETYGKIARCILEVTAAREGNYLVFFPSFAFLREVAASITELSPETADDLIIQTPEMGEADREAFLDAFRSERMPGKRLIGLTVLGGIFAEGVDLKGEALIGAVIVGTGLPLLTASRGVLRDYFDEAGENGFDYAYRFPGMNRVLQAAGRVIRTQEDTGVVVLLDDRFTQSGYRSLFPREWTGVQTLRTDKVRQHLTDFWTETVDSY